MVRFKYGAQIGEAHSYNNARILDKQDDSTSPAESADKQEVRDAPPEPSDNLGIRPTLSDVLFGSHPAPFAA